MQALVLSGILPFRQGLWQQHGKWRAAILATDLVQVNLVTSCFPATETLTPTD